MAHSKESQRRYSPSPSSPDEGAASEREVLSGSEWDSEFPDRIDDRDGENIDLDICAINEAMERKAQS